MPDTGFSFDDADFKIASGPVQGPARELMLTMF